MFIIKESFKTNFHGLLSELRVKYGSFTTQFLINLQVVLACGEWNDIDTHESKPDKRSTSHSKHDQEKELHVPHEEIRKSVQKLHLKIHINS